MVFFEYIKKIPLFTTKKPRRVGAGREKGAIMTKIKKPSTVPVKSKREIAKERKAEESIISTICGNTAPGQRKVSVAWVALASGTHSVEKVNQVTEKYGMKISDGEIDLSGKANLGGAYKEILTKRQKELDEYLKRQQAKKAATKKTKRSK